MVVVMVLRLCCSLLAVSGHYQPCVGIQDGLVCVACCDYATLSLATTPVFHFQCHNLD